MIVYCGLQMLPNLTAEPCYPIKKDSLQITVNFTHRMTIYFYRNLKKKKLLVTHSSGYTKFSFHRKYSN